MAGGISILVVALAVSYFFWPTYSKRKTASKGKTAAVGRDTNAGQDVHDHRFRRDINGLARAFSMVAGRAMGTMMIAGVVSDRSTGGAISGAEVVFTGPSGESSAACDGEGRYQVELLPGFYRSYARAEGYVAVASAAAERLPGAVSAADVAMPQEGIAPLIGVFRDQLGVNLSLSPAARIMGTVVDETGAGISGAIVAGRNNDVHVISGSDVTESDGSGTYEIIVPSGRIEFEVSHARYAALLTNDSAYLGPGEVLRRDLILAAGCIIEGRVIDSEGNSVSSGSFERELAGGQFIPIGEIEQGRVRFASQYEGEVKLRAWPWKSPPSSTQSYHCDANTNYSDETFVIPDAKPTLTGRVLDSDEQPVPLAFVDLFALTPGGATQQERADVQGQFEFFALPDGPYQLSVYVPGKGATITLIDAPSTGVPLRLGGTGSIVGSIADADSGSLQMRYQCAFDLGDQEASLRDELSMPEQTLLVPVSSGRFRIDDLPACPIQGRFSSGPRSESFSVTVVENQDAILRL